MAVNVQQIPLKIVGGNHFGRYPKISVEQTFNMIISDNALVDYAGYKNQALIAADAKGRSIHTSTIGGFMIAVVGSQVFKIEKNAFGVVAASFIPGGNLATSTGDVFIAENNNSEIAITDYVNIYIYNYSTETFKTSGIDFTLNYTFKLSPGFITFQNTRFIVAAAGTNNWVLSAANNGTSWPADAQHVGQLQTKPDTVQAAIPFPGRGNQLFVFGSTIAESWNDVGAALFPYQRNSSFNVDYGCINPSTLAYQDNYVVWIAISEEAGPVLMYSTGGDVHEISTDGIDYQLSLLKAPQDCTAFLVKLDGHLIYHFTFKTDNLTYLYDFNTKEFFTATDEFLNYHIARKIVFFENKYYFVSFNDGNLYEFGTQITNFQYSDTHIAEMPRIRICPPIRLPTQNWFIPRSLYFTVENGQPNTITFNEVEVMITEDLGIPMLDEFGVAEMIDEDALTTKVMTTVEIDMISEDTEAFMVEEIDGTTIMILDYYTDEVTATNIQSNMAIDLAISRDGGENFSSSVRYNMNPTGQRRSRILFTRLGGANDFTPMIQFWGLSRYVAFDGVVEAYT